MIADAWQPAALRSLEAAWPGVEWGIGEADDVRGQIGDVLVTVDRLPRDLGWLRAAAHPGPLGDEVEGMDPRDAARAVRSALRRLGAKAPARMPVTTSQRSA